MEIKLKSGIDKLLFGMKQKDVAAIYGSPSREYKDEEGNIIQLYNSQKIRLTYYADEDFRLGYIISSNPVLSLKNETLIGKDWPAIESILLQHKVKGFEKETFDSIENYFNEDNWVIFQVEFSEVIRVEIGATINAKDEFDWKFK